MTLRQRLCSRAEPLLTQVRAHPFWTGLCDGTLPPASLWHFAEQDFRFTVPAYARALARTAAVARRPEQGALLAGAAGATFESLSRMSRELGVLADRFGTPEPAGGISPTTLAHTSFLTAVSTASLAAAIGGLLPMTWFHQQVCLDLRRRLVPGTRYTDWIAQYCPGDGFDGYVEAYLALIDDFAATASEAELALLEDGFLHGAHYELAFCEAAWQLQSWAGTPSERNS
ncbi:TenA family transcriptional regulator [Streptomyces sp. SID685]|uniref:TenA family protein n=1 Tax=Streptomyces sp. SID685 TaxID=2690322 RepID=UPI00136F9664|nr:TenA family transcriptional regulator [Streptomyces sp. SID685]MYR89846.1 TenA family transcriptional regulator [Streptomyces sp. SID685]